MAKHLLGKRRDYYYIDPEELVLITDPKHDLYDSRVELPVDESLVRNIMYKGVKNPIWVRENGGKPEVIAGRQRAKAAREANRRLSLQGSETRLVPIIYERGTNKEMYGLMVLENELRKEDNPLNKANKALKLYDMGANEEEIAVIFGVSEQTVKNWLSLHDLSDSVKDAIEAGQLSASAASEMSDLGRDEQDTLLEELAEEEGKASASKVREKVQGESAKRPKLRPRREIEKTIKLVASKSDERAQGFLEALQWILGGESTLVQVDDMQGDSDVLRTY